MPYFVILCRGSGIQLPSMSGEEPIIGFYTSRREDADTAEDAITKFKVTLMKEWTHGELAEANQGDLPKLEIEDCWEISFWSRFFGRWRRQGGGYTFYLEE